MLDLAERQKTFLKRWDFQVIYYHNIIIDIKQPPTQ